MPPPRSLTRSLVEAHLDSGTTRGRGPAPGAEISLRVDHVVLDDVAALLAFQCFEARGRTGFSAELALVAAEGPVEIPAFEAGEQLRYVESATRRYGAHFSRPGNGRAHHVYADRFASPGRVVLGCPGGAASAGGLASLVYPVGELEAAAALAGAAHAIRVPEVWAVPLTGTFPPGVGPHDLVLRLARTLPSAGRYPVVIEFSGPAVAALGQEDRFAVASLGAGLGLPMAVFPCDESSRSWLRAHGREPEWKPLGGEPEADAQRVIEVHLDGLEPSALRVAEGADPLAVREVAGLPVRRVVIGMDAGLADLLRVAEAVSGRRVAPAVEFVVVPGSRSIRTTLAACGAQAALEGAGVLILDTEARIVPNPSAGAVLTFGASSPSVLRAPMTFRVGPALAAASALAGCISDPRDLPSPAAAFPWPERVDPCEVVAARPEAARQSVVVERGTTIRPLPTPAPLTGTLRGVVLARLPDRVSTERVLPDGPRVWRHRGDPAALAEHLFTGFDPAFPARARALGGGFVVAGAEYGLGPRRPLAALAMVALGIRAVIATSFAADHRDELVLHGLLPLRPGADMDPGAAVVGDELEIPGLPEALEWNKPIVVRNLTRGTQVTLNHDLTARQIDCVCAGGLLAAPIGEPARA